MNKEQRICRDDCGKFWRLTRHENGVVTLENISPGLTEFPCSELPVYFSSRVPCQKTRDKISDQIPVYKKIEINPEIISQIPWLKYLLYSGAAILLFSVIRKLWK